MADYDDRAYSRDRRGRGRSSYRGRYRGRGRGRYHGEWENGPASQASASTAVKSEGSSHPGTTHATPPSNLNDFHPPAPPPPPSRSSRSVAPVLKEGWQYRDPEGNEHGPHPAAKLIAWVQEGVFSTGLMVRKVTGRGAGAWTPLGIVLQDIQREAALTIVPIEETPSAEHGHDEPAVKQDVLSPRIAERALKQTAVAGGSSISVVTGKEMSRRAPVSSPGRELLNGRAPPPPPPSRPRGSRPTSPDHRPRSVPVEEKPPGERGESQAIPLLAAQAREQVHVERISPPARVIDSYGGRFGGRKYFTDRHPMDGDYEYGRGRGGGRYGSDRAGGRGAGFGRGRGRYPEDRGFPRGRSSGRYGRGYGRGRGAVPPHRHPDIRNAIHRLFTAEAEMATDEPMWRYLDMGGNMQGPYPAQKMEEWWDLEYLNSGIAICGTERKVSAPNLPPMDFFIPLGALLYAVRRGKRLSVITVADIRSKALPKDLQELKEGAKKMHQEISGQSASGEDSKGGMVHTAQDATHESNGNHEHRNSVKEETDRAASISASEVSSAGAVFSSALKQLLLDENENTPVESQNLGEETSDP